MNEEVMAPMVVMYHKNCMDGWGAALSVYAKFSSVPDYMPVQYGDAVDLDSLKGKIVYILDFSFPANVMEEIAAVADRVVLIDHHDTARIDLLESGWKAPKNVKLIFDLTRSGAVLSWTHFHGIEIPEILLHVQDRDLWIFGLYDTMAISMYISSLGLNIDEWNYKHFIEEWDINKETILTEGRAILRSHRRKLKSILNSPTQQMRIGGIVVPVVNCGTEFASEVGEYLSRQAPFSATYVDLNNKRVFSLRSNPIDGVHVGKVAKLYGGGGHPGAAGFSMPLEWRGDTDD